MSVNTLWIAIILLAIVGFFWFKKQNLNKKNIELIEENEKNARQFQCVEIKYNNSACQAVRMFKGKKMLPKESPLLPVKGCDKASTCSCKFVRFDDRRTENRREEYLSARQMIIGGDFTSNNQDKRIRKDRRKSKKMPK